MLRRLLCKIGWHKWKWAMPEMYNGQMLYGHDECRYCGKTKKDGIWGELEKQRSKRKANKVATYTWL